MSRARRADTARRLLDDPDPTLLDLVDNLLDKGVVIGGELTLGVADVDLIYLQLSALLCAADRVLPSTSPRWRTRAPRPAEALAARFAPGGPPSAGLARLGLQRAPRVRPRTARVRPSTSRARARMSRPVGTRTSRPARARTSRPVGRRR